MEEPVENHSPDEETSRTNNGPAYLIAVYMEEIRDHLWFSYSSFCSTAIDQSWILLRLEG